MPIWLFDTSAAVKHFHPETGSNVVAQLFAMPTARIIISSLGRVELLSAFAIKVKVGTIPARAFDTLRRQLANEIVAKRIEIVEVRPADFRRARSLITAHGVANGLRALDAIQLAVALNLKDEGLLDHLVSADQVLNAVARAERISVVDPTAPLVPPK